MGRLRVFYVLSYHGLHIESVWNAMFKVNSEDFSGRGEKGRLFLSSTISKRKHYHEGPTTSAYLIKFEDSPPAKVSYGGGRIWEASVHSLHLSNYSGRLSSPNRG